MIANILSPLHHVVDYVGPNTFSLIFLKLFSLIGASYILWRSWAFIVLPALRPHDPRELPYLIPVLGHAVSFIKDAQSLVSYGKKYFHDSGEPFALKVGGKTLYVVTSAADVGAIYKNNTTLSWDAMLNDLLIAFGVNSVVIPKLWQMPDLVPRVNVDSLGGIHPKPLSPIHSTLDHYKRQLLPGKHLDKFNEVLFGHINDSLCWENVHRQYGTMTTRVSLKDFCAKVLVEALSRTMFGSQVCEKEPDLVRSMIDFNDDSWMLIFQYPQSPTSKLHTARRKLLDFFSRYIEGPKEARSGQAWVIDRVLEDLKDVNMGDEDKAPLLLMIYWGGNINPYKFAFWMVSYILFDLDLLVALRAETRQSIQDGKVDLSHLMNCCPRLNAVFLETLRVTSGALSARKVVHPTPLGKKILGSGNTVLIPLRQLHYNEAVFGTDSQHFTAERFLRDKGLRNSSSFKPFGGGVSHCPGQARDARIRDTRLKTQNFPTLNEFTPSLGVNGPVKGSDVYVNFRKAET